MAILRADPSAPFSGCRAQRNELRAFALPELRSPRGAIPRGAPTTHRPLYQNARPSPAEPRNVLLDDLRRAAPYAILLALGLGAVVVAGAHLSNAFPSEKAPFGWPGPSSFERGVAMVRSDLVLAASLPALLLGARALKGREPSRESATALLPTYATHVALLVASVAVAATIGALGAGETPFDAWFAFVTAHSVLAASFYSIAFLFAGWMREHAVAAAAAAWIAFLGLYEAITRTILFRTEGYHNLASGAFPSWFWVAQGLSPLSSYTGILILWRERFRDYMETEALKNAVLPGWLVPATFVGLAIVLWMLVPLALGLAGWTWRRGAAARASASRPLFAPRRDERP